VQERDAAEEIGAHVPCGPPPTALAEQVVGKGKVNGFPVLVMPVRAKIGE
jgi:hypothetical protein